MKFEYDLTKSKLNKEKHGIDFEEAKNLWNNLIAVIPSKYIDEQRKLVIGLLDKKFWTAIITERKGIVRLISVRRSRMEENKLYEKIAENN